MQTQALNPVVVKFSGKALGARDEILSLCQASLNRPLVLVHGGGVEVDALFSSLKLKVEKIDGLRVSPKEQMPYITGALGGTCNKALQSLAVLGGLNAVGMLCSDGKTLSVTKFDERLGMVGKVSPKDGTYLKLLLLHGYTPVIASLAMDERGDLYNVNADDVAEAIAVLLKAPLYYISDVPGVFDGEKKTIQSLSPELAQKLMAQGVIAEGMAVKVKSAQRASDRIGCNVYIASYKDPNLASAIGSSGAIGTAFAPSHN